MSTRPTIARHLAAAALALGCTAAIAGGHLDVDDSGTVDPGRCQYEAWFGRVAAHPVPVAHFGPACRVGPFEVTLNIDRFGIADSRDHDLILGPQLKWLFWGTAEDVWSAALSATVSFETRHGGRKGGQFLVPVTWHPREDLFVHANLGADWAEPS